jgi:dsRNA-specific ribonuclease
VNKLHEAFEEFNRKINAIVSRDEAKEIAKECGLHRYMVKKYGIEAVTTACCGPSHYTEACGI